MCSLGVNGEEESRGQLANSGSAGKKWSLNRMWIVDVCTV